MLKFAILKSSGNNVAIVGENVTYVESTPNGGTRIHFGAGEFVDADDRLDEAVRKLKSL